MGCFIAEPSVVTETGVVSQDTLFSVLCQDSWMPSFKPLNVFLNSPVKFKRDALTAMVSLFFHVHPCLMKMLLSQPWLHCMENMTVPHLFLGIYLKDFSETGKLRVKEGQWDWDMTQVWIWVLCASCSYISSACVLSTALTSIHVMIVDLWTNCVKCQ